jgi:hypothetical protein
MYFCLNYPSHPPTPSPFGQAGQLTGNLSATARVPIFVLWAVLYHVDGTLKTAIHQISKENAVLLSPKFVFLFACTHLYSHVSLYPSVIVIRIRTRRNVNLHQSFHSDVMHADVCIITSSCRTKYALYNVANIMENLTQHSPVQYSSFLTCLKTRESDDYEHIFAVLFYLIFRHTSVCNSDKFVSVSFTKQASNES